MKIKIWLALFMLMLSAYGNPIYAADADAGDKMISLSGALLEQIPKRMSVRQIEQLAPLAEVTMYDPWDKRTERYQGILMNEFVRKLGQPGIKELLLSAIDEYQVTFHENEWQQFRIMIVTRVNGEYLSVREKGPMKIIFPDYEMSNKSYELNRPKWLWMINRIEFK